MLKTIRVYFGVLQVPLSRPRRPRQEIKVATGGLSRPGILCRDRVFLCRDKVWPWARFLCRDIIFYVTTELAKAGGNYVATEQVYVAIELAKVGGISIATEDF